MDIEAAPRGRATRFPLSLAIACSLLPLTGQAHHAYAEYDQEQTVEIEGTLTKAVFQNPHLSLKVQVAGRDPVIWDIEGSGLNALERMNAPLEKYKLGDKVKVAGWPSKRASNRMFLTNLLSQDGVEMVTWRYATARWAKTAAGYASDRTRFEGGTPTANTSVFRVWTVQVGVAGAAFDQSVAGLATTTRASLTEKGKAAAAAIRPVRASDCTPRGMPEIMFTPTPIELIDEGDAIQLRVELYDSLRVIHMNGGESQSAALLGYSVGRWEDKTLVVETTKISWRLLTDGVPQSPAARLVERFTPSADGSRLDYTLTATDPEMLAAPVALKNTWVWRQSEHLLPYNCVSNYQK